MNKKIITIFVLMFFVFSIIAIAQQVNVQGCKKEYCDVKEGVYDIKMGGIVTIEGVQLVGPTVYDSKNKRFVISAGGDADVRKGFEGVVEFRPGAAGTIDGRIIRGPAKISDEGDFISLTDPESEYNDGSGVVKGVAEVRGPITTVSDGTYTVSDNEKYSTYAAGAGNVVVTKVSKDVDARGYTVNIEGLGLVNDIEVDNVYDVRVMESKQGTTDIFGTVPGDKKGGFKGMVLNPDGKVQTDFSYTIEDNRFFLFNGKGDLPLGPDGRAREDIFFDISPDAELTAGGLKFEDGQLEFAGGYAGIPREGTVTINDNRVESLGGDTLVCSGVNQPKLACSGAAEMQINIMGEDISVRNTKTDAKVTIEFPRGNDYGFPANTMMAFGESDNEAYLFKGDYPRGNPELIASEDTMIYSNEDLLVLSDQGKEVLVGTENNKFTSLDLDIIEHQEMTEEGVLYTSLLHLEDGDCVASRCVGERRFALGSAMATGRAGDYGTCVPYGTGGVAASDINNQYTEEVETEISEIWTDLDELSQKRSNVNKQLSKVRTEREAVEFAVRLQAEREVGEYSDPDDPDYQKQVDNVIERILYDDKEYNDLKKQEIALKSQRQDLESEFIVLDKEIRDLETTMGAELTQRDLPEPEEVTNPSVIERYENIDVREAKWKATTDEGEVFTFDLHKLARDQLGIREKLIWGYNSETGYFEGDRIYRDADGKIQTMTVAETRPLIDYRPDEGYVAVLSN